jgi:hypothetical protein
VGRGVSRAVASGGMKDQPELLMHSCAGCGTSWFGLVRVHCSVCHVTLDSVDMWDTHRVEDECVRPATLGLVKNKGGVWEERVQAVRRRAS